MFSIHQYPINLDPVIGTPLDDESLLYTCRLDNFDREGFELLPIECLYYENAGIELFNKDVLAKESGDPDGWSSAITSWAVQVEKHPNIYLDHSYFCTAYEFVDDAYDQIMRVAKLRPELYKLAYCKVKYGTDFCVDYIDETGPIELIHFEWDFYEDELDDLLAHKELAEDLITNTDWKDFANYVIRNKHNWEHLDAEGQGDMKAKMFGLKSAFRLKKRI